MRKFIVALLSLAIVVTLAGCLGEETNSNKKRTPQTEINKDLEKITVVSREEGSGTRATFEKLIGFNQKNEEGDIEEPIVDDAMIKDKNAEVIASVVEKQSSIGYISFISLEEQFDVVKGLGVNGVEPTITNILSGNYPLARPFNMIYEEEKLSDVASAFITFIKSTEGTKVIATEGGIVDMSGRKAFRAFAYGDLVGELVLGGSTSAEVVAIALAEEFAALFKNVTFTYRATASKEGIEQAEEGGYDIGFASRIINPDELKEGFRSEVICMDGIALIVSAANEATDVSEDQIKGIYTGIIKDWREINK